MAKVDRQGYLERRKLAEQAFGEVLHATKELLAPLKDLTVPQKDAVVALGLLARVASLGRRPSINVPQAVLEQFAADVDRVCPPLGKGAVSKDPCLEATLSYMSALKDCEEDGRTEDKCQEAWGPAAAALACVMKEIDGLKREIGERLGRQVPPRPIPWPRPIVPA
jgi:hypothetical protein